MGQKQPLPWDGQSRAPQEEEANVTLFLSVCLPWSPACLVCPVASHRFSPSFSLSILVLSLSSSLPPSLSVQSSEAWPSTPPLAILQFGPWTPDWDLLPSLWPPGQSGPWCPRELPP